MDASHTAIGLLVLFVGLWTSGILTMFNIPFLNFLPSITLPEVAGISTGYIVLGVGLLITIYSFTELY